MFSTSYATLTGPGQAQVGIPNRSDRRLPSKEWGVWSERVSTLTGIELGHRVKEGFIGENGYRGNLGRPIAAQGTIVRRAKYPTQEASRF